MIAACRTAFDDGMGGARNNHDANFLTFHRISNFRTRTMKDSAPMPEVTLKRHDLGEVVVTGSGFELATLTEGGRAFSNRDYAWRNVPPDHVGWTYTRTAGGERATIAVKAVRDTEIWMATARSERAAPQGWQATSGTFHYTDRGNTALAVFSRKLKGGDEIALPQGNWTGALLLIPRAKQP